MRKINLILALSILGILLLPVSVQADKAVCTIYFTYIGCPNCAFTDPMVLTEWTEKYDNLVVIEYMWLGGDYQDPNSQFFGEYAMEYGTQAAVPYLSIDKDNIRLGRLDIPSGETDIEAKKSNPCPLPGKPISFEELDLNKLQGKPKIWANGRILISLEENNWLFQWNGEKIGEEIKGNENITDKLLKDLLFTDDIFQILNDKKFKSAEPQKAEFSGIAFPGHGFILYKDFENAIKIKIGTSACSCPEPPEWSECIGGEKARTNYKCSAETNYECVPYEETEECDPEEEPERHDFIEIPFFGKIEIAEFSLPVLTVILATVDGVTNPCGFFVLFFLLAALLGLAGARKRMFLVGCIFVAFFALYYFLFMAVLLNIFILGKEIATLTIIAGAICIFAGIINLKDYFFFQKGMSFSLSRGGKSKFMERVKNLSLSKSILGLVVGTTIIASTISLVAIACTFGIPLAYTKILTSADIPYLQYYLYLIFYNLIYIIPMLIIISIFSITLGEKGFGKLWIRRLKLISGFIILFLGSVLAWNYTLLENISFIFELIILAIIVSVLIIFIDHIRKKK